MSVIFDPNKAPQRATERRRPKVSFTFRRLIRILGFLILLTLVGLGGWKLWSYTQTKEPEPISQGLPADQELIVPINVFLSEESKKSNQQIKIKFISPKEWLARRVDVQPTSLLEAKDFSVLAFDFQGIGEGSAKAEMQLENISKWLTATEKSPLLPSVSSVDIKAEYINSVKSGELETIKDLPKYTNEAGPRISGKKVASRDGKFEGIIYVTFFGKSAFINLDAYGEVDGEKLSYRMRIPSPAETKIEDLQNGNLDQATAERLNKVQEIFESTSVGQ